MKPTNIFSTFSKYYNEKSKNLTKKTGKTNIDKINAKAAQEAAIEDQVVEKGQELA